MLSSLGKQAIDMPLVLALDEDKAITRLGLGTDSRQNVRFLGQKRYLSRAQYDLSFRFSVNHRDPPAEFVDCCTNNRPSLLVHYRQLPASQLPHLDIPFGWSRCHANGQPRYQPDPQECRRQSPATPFQRLDSSFGVHGGFPF